MSFEALIIDLELEEGLRREEGTEGREGAGRGKKRQFGAPRASRTLPRLKLGRRERVSERGIDVCAQQINFLGGPPPPLRTPANEFIVVRRAMSTTIRISGRAYNKESD